MVLLGGVKMVIKPATYIVGYIEGRIELYEALAKEVNTSAIQDIIHELQVILKHIRQA